jgi:hypothetical protein
MAAMESRASGPSVLFEHDDVVEPRLRFPSISYRGHAWDLRHLHAFAIRIDPKLGFEIDVIVLFSCHCFTHQIKHDERSAVEIPECEIYKDGNERRVRPATHPICLLVTETPPAPGECAQSPIRHDAESSLQRSCHPRVSDEPNPRKDNGHRLDGRRMRASLSRLTRIPTPGGTR